MRVNVGEEKKRRLGVLRDSRRLWGFVGGGVLEGKKRGIRGLIKVTSECFILSKPPSWTGNTLRGFPEWGSQRIGGDLHFSVCLNMSQRRDRAPGSGLPV